MLMNDFDRVVNGEIIIWEDNLVAFRGTVLILIKRSAYGACSGSNQELGNHLDLCLKTEGNKEQLVNQHNLEHYIHSIK